MYCVWTNWQDKEKRLRVAGSDCIHGAMHYARQYREEGEVTVKKGNRIVAILCAQKDEFHVSTPYLLV